MSIVVLRTLILYITILFSLRVMGKRQLGELETGELVVTLLVSNLATLSIEDTSVPMVCSFLPIFTLVCCEILTSTIILKSRTARKIVSGNPRILIRDGVIDQQEMKNLRWSIDDLTERLRINNIFDIREVSFAIVETSGSLSAYPKFSARPVTAEMMSLQPNGKSDAPPMTVICDGDLDMDALRFLNLREEWLNGILAEKNLSIGDVFLMTCDRQAQYNIVSKKDVKKK